MDEYQLALEDAPAPEDVELVRAGLRQFNLARTRADDARPLMVFLRGPAGQVVGGLTGMTFWGWLAIDHLWVREDARGRGYGARLVQMAEEEAVARGCRRALLDTMSFQAPEFYRKLGYQEFGVLEGFAGPHSRHYFQKALGRDERA